MFDEECGCVFHAGFKEVADAVVEDLEQFLEPGAEVKLAGHSLGGAAAVIVAAKLKLRGYNVGKVHSRTRACKAGLLSWLSVAILSGYCLHNLSRPNTSLRMKASDQFVHGGTLIQPSVLRDGKFYDLSAVCGLV